MKAHKDEAVITDYS